MSKEEKAELLNRPRCINCGSVIQNCCEVPRLITWNDLIDLERKLFINLIRSDYLLKERFPNIDKVKLTLNEIEELKLVMHDL